MENIVNSQQRYGYPLIKRKEYIKKAMEHPEEKTYESISFRNKTENLLRIVVPIELPIYRLKNGRTQTDHLEYIEENHLNSDYFDRDEGSFELQSIQHKILKRHIEEEGLIQEFKANMHQTEALICTENGVVVNGNRRLCTWRELYYDNPEKYSHLKTVTIVILPPCTDDDIYVLERQLQIKKDLKSKYKWHARALMMKNDRKNGKTVEDIAKDFDTTQKDVNLTLGAYQFAERYLKEIGKPQKWSELDNNVEHAFRAIVENSDKFDSSIDQALFETISIAYFKDGGDARGYDNNKQHNIPKIKNYYDYVIADLKKEYDSEINAEKSNHITPEPDDDIDILCSKGNPQKNDDDRKILTSILMNEKDNKKIADIISETVREREQLSSEKKKIDSISTHVKNANKDLSTAIELLHNPANKYSKEGISTLILEAENMLKIIKKWAENGH